MVNVMFYGKLGSGKTLSAVLTAAKAYSEGLDTYSNIELSWPYTRIKNIFDFMDKSFSVFLVSEAYLAFDSRLWSNKNVQAGSNLLLQVRKKGNMIVFDAQDPDSIEKRLRLIVDFWVRCNYNKNTRRLTWEVDDGFDFGKKSMILNDALYKMYNTYEPSEILYNQ